MANKRLLISPLVLAVSVLATSLLVTTPTQAMVTDGMASYYGARFHGRLTASGERFNMHKLTAAHRTLKFGTRVMVTNKANGRSIAVTINDRGPFIKGRSIDLSKSAAEELGMIGRGVAPVKLAVVSGSGSVPSNPEKLSVAQAQQIMVDLF